MIANELEYQVTKEEAERFARALASIASRQSSGRAGARPLPPGNPHTGARGLAAEARQTPPNVATQRLLRIALESQLQDLREQLAEYEARTGGGA
jgi:hypothetical protein